MQRRSLGTMFILLLVTFGIYELYWLMQVRQEINSRTTAKIPPVSYMFTPLGLLILCVLIGFAGRGSSVVNALTSLIGFLAAPGFIFIVFWWRWRFSKGMKDITNGHYDTPYTFWMWFITNGMWTLVLQHEFNSMAPQAGVHMDMPVQPLNVTPQGRPDVPPSSTWDNIRQQPTATPPPAEPVAPAAPMAPPSTPATPDPNEPTAPWNTPPNQPQG
jgi:hypothetical protein